MKDALYRLIHLDPALFRGLILAVVGLLGSLGIIITPGLPDELLGVLVSMLALIQAVWTRQAVTPNVKVAVMVPDPISNPNTVAPGQAITGAPSAEVVHAARTGSD